jgi:hypothetical protein
MKQEALFSPKDVITWRQVKGGITRFFAMSKGLLARGGYTQKATGRGGSWPHCDQHQPAAWDG